MKFEFWASLGNPRHERIYEEVEIPDEKLNGLSDREKESVMIKAHTNWILKHAYGDWEPILPQAIGTTEST